MMGRLWRPEVRSQLGRREMWAMVWATQKSRSLQVPMVQNHLQVPQLKGTDVQGVVQRSAAVPRVALS
jgi:hypothetical protein